MIKIKKLRELIVNHKIDGYIVPKNDKYFSEFAYPDRLKSISNFTGSAGFAIILLSKNYLFVDGRYTIQAKKETKGKFKIIEIPKILPFNLFKKFKKKLNIGFDPNVFTSHILNVYFKNSCNLRAMNQNLIDIITSKKSRNINNIFYNLNKDIAGETIQSKINRVSKILNKNNIDNLFISAPENSAWLLNLRGRDNPDSPIPNCRIIISKNKKIYLFANSLKTKQIRKNPLYKNINFRKCNEFFSVINKLIGNNFCIDKTTCSVFNEFIIKSKFKISKYNDPCYQLKAIKNSIEINHMKKAHIEDGVALTKFLFWIKNNKLKNTTEIDIIKKLEKFRKKNKNYLYPSFSTIAGSGPNSAIIHYKANKKTNRKIRKDDLLLCDSGGQYKYGTTDVTRTICFKKPTKKIKDIFTRVLKGHIAVTTTNLNKINKGYLIDKKAREWLKKINLDYSHGTGHGVGFFLNVHEGPQAISKYNKVSIKKGMIISNEPGYYLEGKFGIRIENLIYVDKEEKKPCFKNLTFAPIDNDLINNKLLNKMEQNYLFNYHLETYSKISKFLNKKERMWLQNLI